MSNALSLEGLRPDQIRRLVAIRAAMVGWIAVGFAVERISDSYLIGYDGKTGKAEDALMADRAEAIAWRDRQIADDAGDAEEWGDDAPDPDYRLVVVYQRGADYDTCAEESVE